MVGARGRSSFPFCQQYLAQYKRPSVLPITRFNEGMEGGSFLGLFGPAQPEGCCVLL